MEYQNSISYSFSGRVESQYVEINDSINKLIDDLGLKVQRQLITIEQKTLLAYKNSLLSTQNAFKDLKQLRNDEAIKHNIFALKASQEKAYQDATQKSLQMGKLYDKLKLDLKQVGEYSHQLQLQLKFLAKQTKVTKGKSQVLEAEILELEHRRQKETVIALQRNQSCKKISRQGSKLQTLPQKQAKLYERRLRDKIEHLNQFLQLMKEEETGIQAIFAKYDFDSFKSQRQRGTLFLQLFQDKEFKRFIYNVLFAKRNKEVLRSKK